MEHLKSIKIHGYHVDMDLREKVSIEKIKPKVPFYTNVLKKRKKK